MSYLTPEYLHFVYANVLHYSVVTTPKSQWFSMTKVFYSYYISIAGKQEVLHPVVTQGPRLMDLGFTTLQLRHLEHVKTSSATAGEEGERECKGSDLSN